jgi:hypothetical protein
VRASVYWKGNDEESDDEGMGPMIIQHEDGPLDESEEWARRSTAEAYAAEHGLASMRTSNAALLDRSRSGSGPLSPTFGRR